MSFAKLALILPLVFVVLFADKSCDIDLGDIGDFIVKYDVVVTNTGPEEALIGIYGPDIKASAIVAPGESVAATSYQGGSFTVYAQPSVDVIAELKSRKVDIETQLAQRPLNQGQATSLYQELDAINATLKDKANVTSGGACFTRLQPDSAGKGQEVDLTASKDDKGWHVTGFCAI